MALIDKASLLMVPSTYEAGKLYNVLPSGNRAPDNKGGAGYDQTRADFDFDRGSNAAATRINSSGLIEKYRENVLLQSNQFDTTWTFQGATLTSGQIGYDSSNDAWSLISTTVNGSHRIIQTFTGVSNSIVTYSVFAKSNGYNFLRIIENASTGDFATFNLSNGSVANNTAIANTATIASVGNGWYRCSVSVDGGNITRFDIYTMETSGATDFLGDGVSGAYIQNAQVETGLVATEYLNSTSVTAKAGVLIDLPRINYDANGENGSLLLEPSRQQLIPQSEYFGGGDWTRTNIGAITNAIISPQGVQNATKLTESGATNTNFRLRSSSTSTSGANTLSIFAKAGERNWVFLRENAQTGVFAYFNLEDGTIGQNTADNPTIEPYGNGWYRISISDVLTSVGMDLRIAIADGDNDYDGVSGYGVYVFGAQLEANASYATSYIPNHGTSGGVTRAADSCNSSSLTTSTDFTIFFEAKDFCLINGGTTAGYAGVQFVFGPSINPYDAGGSYHIYANSLYYYNGSANTNFGVIFNNQTDSKFALVKRGNKGIIYANGVKKTEATLPSGADAKVINWDTINLTSSLQDAQGDVFGSNYKQLVKFDEALTDSELATLTTL